jgi:alkaline phosphatase D
MDLPTMDCKLAENAEHPDCNCKPTFLKHPHRGCLSGDVQNAQRKIEGVIRSAGYRAFVEYMCPGAEARGEFPPAGGDRRACPRPILGTYDDHDFGWNNGNGEELSNRQAIKQVWHLHTQFDTQLHTHFLW